MERKLLTTNFYEKSAQIGCTYYKFGEYRLYQPKYECTTCLNDSICIKCIKTCHANCKHNFSEETTTINEKFICGCAKQQGHEARKIFEIEEVTATNCNLMAVDLKLDIKENFFCLNHNVNICCLCFLKCHNECELSKKEKGGNCENSVICNCKNEANHNFYNHFVFDLEMESFKKITEIDFGCNLKIINYLSKIGVFKQMALVINKFLDDGVLTQTIKEIIKIIADKIRKKDFSPEIYAEEILEIFPLEKLIKFLVNVEMLKQSDCKIVMELVSILYSFHLKRDFKNLKHLSVSDFSRSFIIERINFRRNFSSGLPNFYPQGIYNKYSQNFDLIRRIVFKFIDSFKTSEDGFDSYIIYLKMIKFCIKRSFFLKEDYLKLVDLLYDFIEMIQIIDKDVMTNFHNKIIIGKFKQIFNEIIFMISITYNDFVIEKKLEEGGFYSIMTDVGGSKHSLDLFNNFLNFKNEITSKLLQTFIQVSSLDLFYLQKKKIEYSKIQTIKEKFVWNLLSENIKIFTVCDNIYYSQLKHLKKFTSSSSKAIESVSSNSNSNYKSIFTEFAAKLQQIEKDLYIDSVINIDYLFISFKNLSEILIPSLKSNRAINNSITDNLLDKKLDSKFVTTLLSELKNYFEFLNSVRTDNEIDLLISEFIKNNLDSSILNLLIKTSFFSGFSAEKTEEHILREKQSIEFFFKFLKILCLSKKGIEFITTGKTLQTLCKLLKSYRFEILNLLYTILKAANKFNIDISNHIFISLFEKENSDFWLEFDQMTLDSENSQKNFHIVYSLILMMKIVNKISHAFAYEVYESIKMQIKKSFLRKKSEDIFNVENFKKIVNEVCNRQKEILSANDNIKYNRHIVTPSVNSLVENSVGEKLIPKMKPEQNNEELELMNLKGQDIYQRMKMDNCPQDNPLQIQNLSEYDILTKFYFAFFELISKDTVYIKYNDSNISGREEYYELINFLSEPIEIFLNLPISISKRKILFRTIRSFYFIEHLDDSRYDCKKKTCSNQDCEVLQYDEDEEFRNYIKKLPYHEKSKYTRDEYIKIGMKKKLKVCLGLQKHIDDFTEELNQFPKLFEKCERNEKFHDYIVEILLSIKFICEYLINEEDFWNGVNNNLVKLTKMLVNRLKILSEYFQQNFNAAEMDAKINLFSLELSAQNFKTLDKPEINKIIYEIFEIIFPAEMKFKFFEKFLNKFDKIRSINFLPDSLTDEKSFGIFTKNLKTEIQIKKSIKNKENNVFKTIKTLYINQFSDFDNSTFVQLIKIKNLNNKLDYLEGLMILFKYFICYSDQYTLNNFYTYLTLINKMLFYNTEATQEKFFENFLIGEEDNKKQEDRNKLLWSGINGLIHDSYNYYFSLSKSYFSDSLKINLLLLTNEIIHFYKLLSENRNSKFHSEFFEQQDTFIYRDSPSIFSVYFSYFMMMYRFVISEDVTKNVRIPHDIYICNIKNIVDCFIEYFESLDETVHILPFDNEKSISKRKEKRLMIINYLEQFMKEIFQEFPMIILTDFSKYNYNASCINYRSEYIKKNIVCSIKYQIFRIFISYMSHTKKFDINDTLNYMNLESLYKEIFVNFKFLLDYQTSNNKLETNILDFSENTLFEKLDRLYIIDEEFRNSPVMDYCLAMVYYIKILTQSHEIQEFSEDLEERGVRLKYKNGKPIIDGAIPKTDNNYFSIMGYKIYNYLERLIIKIDVFNGVGNEFIYFKRPFLTFYLPEDSKLNFENTVNRESVSTKLNSLYKETDYFIFEMNYNYHQKSTKNIVKTIQNFNFLYFEIINYILILVHQILLIVEFYKSTREDDVNYNILENNETMKFLLGNLILSIIQCVFLGVILILWMVFKFPLKFQRSIIKNLELKLISYDESDYSSNRVPFQTLRKIFVEENIGTQQIISLFNKKLSFGDKILSAYNSIVLNKDVNLMFLSFILTLTYLIVRQPLLLVFPSFFIVNFFPTLFDIFIAIRLKYKQLITVLLFTYLTIYFFVWVSLLFLSEFFLYEDISDGKGTQIKENYCSSSIQCIFFMIDYGTRSGGGIGDMINKISFKSDPSLFFVKFIFNLIFHILIILVLSNIFLGLIVDTFADLRDKTQLILFDKNKRCFICQLTSDDAVKRKINFSLHVTQDHLLWNYVYFLTQMYISNKNNFTPLERGIWEKIRNKDLTWIPVENISI